MAKQRLSNFELMRIISIILIIFYHTIIHSNILIASHGTIHGIFEFLIDIVIIHVNSFVLLTGYFQYNHNFSSKKIWSTLKTTIFYKISIPIILFIIGIISLNTTDIVSIIYPFNNYWFIYAYLGVYAISPFLNKTIEQTTKKEHKHLIIILTIFSSIIPYLSHQHLLTNNGFSIISFINLYIIGAYIHKYQVITTILAKFSKWKIRSILLISIILIALINFGTWCFTYFFSNNNNNIIKIINEIFTQSHMSYSNPLVIIQSICYFLFFNSFNFKSKFINALGTLPIGIYLIHENEYIRNNIYTWLKININNFSSTITLILYLLLMTIIIFIICAIIEKLRQKTLNYFKRKYKTTT